MASSPCIGVCSTIYGDDICRGCKRHYQEIIDWNQLDDIRQQTILQRIEHQIVQVLQPEVELFDLTLLKQQLSRLALRYHPEQDPLCWIFELIRLGYDKIQDVEKYGFKFNATSIEESLLMRYRRWDEQIYQLAHHH